MELSVHSDEHFMKQALKQANIAFEKGEVPVGAVVVAENRIIARAHNMTEQLTDVTAHAEMLAITAAFDAIGGKYLNECTLYVTLEPCNMCAGALYWAQLGKLVFGASDQKRGFTLNPKNLLHPRTEVVRGLLENQSESLLKQFFAQLR
ncbi:nucleoside deaminase [Roseivirga thermotolerans]|uniref:tRNA-specific adenosine deaminase n=1 Tax=Roseivirga thermotolerans TaxID=1758176 RepID=A0ABQ3I365_9BACT|nr:nucleoside deaminase [Roseivirga thermotolerans]MEC7752908.1 nucleoside deaminase [Bacteroidota bacterium]GHE53221.1 tRNA-specific adenosine deaminase [Roseivirga thermotolerans]